jgi:hypothetical protein
MRLIEVWLKVYVASGQAQYQPGWSVQMSAPGTKQMFKIRRSMSAFGAKADIAIHARHFRF